MFLRCSGIDGIRGIRTFRFEAAWASHQDYGRVVENAWDRGNQDVVWRVKEDSIVCNKEVFGNIFRRKRHLEARLKGVQRSFKAGYTSDLLWLEKQLQHDYEVVLAQEEMLWYQKSKER